MSHLTLQLPDSLYRQLERLANDEAVSLNQYIIHALTRQIAFTHTVQSVSENEVSEQRAAYAALLQNLGRASFDEIENILERREKVGMEKALIPDVVESIRRKIERAGRSHR